MTTNLPQGYEISIGPDGFYEVRGPTHHSAGHVTLDDAVREAVRAERGHDAMARLVKRFRRITP